MSPEMITRIKLSELGVLRITCSNCGFTFELTNKSNFRIKDCGHCRRDFRSSGEQLEKLRDSLYNLADNPEFEVQFEVREAVQ